MSTCDIQLQNLTGSIQAACQEFMKQDPILGEQEILKEAINNLITPTNIHQIKLALKGLIQNPQYAQLKETLTNILNGIINKESILSASLESDSVQVNVPSGFIPIFNEKLNSEVYQIVSRQINNLVLQSPVDGTINYSDEKFNRTINVDYRKQLINKLASYVESLTGTAPAKCYDRFGNFKQEAYIKLISYVKEYIIPGLSFNKNNPCTYNYKGAQELLDPIIAYYILNAYDSTIEGMLGHVVDIKPQFKNKIVGKNTIKYTIKTDKIQGHNFNDGIINADSSLNKMNILDTWLYGISLEGAENPHAKTTSGKKPGDLYITDAIKAQLEFDIYGDIYKYDPNINQKYAIQIVNEDLPYKDRVDALLNYLKNYNSKTGVGIILYKKLKEYISEYEKLQTSALYEQRKQYLEHYLNIPHLLINSITRHVPTSMQQGREDRKGHIAGFAAVKEDKSSIRQAIKNTIISNVLNGNFDRYYDLIIINSDGDLESYDFVSTVGQQALFEQLGIYLPQEKINTLLQEKEIIKHINRLLYDVRNFVLSLEMLNLNESELRKRLDAFWREEMMFNDSYLDFSTFLIENEITTKKKIKNSEGDLLPAFSEQAMYNQYMANLRRFKEQGGQNVMTEHAEWFTSTSRSKFQQPYALRQEAEIGKYKNGKSRAVKGVNLNILESMDMTMNTDFIQNYVENGMFGVQVNCNSDKTSIILALMNATRVSLNPEEDFYTVFYNAEKEQRIKYFTKIAQDTVSKWIAFAKYTKNNKIKNALKPLLTENNKLASFITLHNEIFSELNSIKNWRQELYKFLKANPNISFIDEIDYKASKDLKPNNELVSIISNVLNGNPLQEVEEQKLQWVATLNASKIPCILYKVSKISQTQVEQLLSKKLRDQLKNKKVQDLFTEADVWEYTENPTELKQKVMNELIDLQFIMQAMLTDASIMIEAKHSFNHANKSKSGNLEDEVDSRYVTSTKRGNANVATMLRLQTGKTYGIPYKTKIAIIEDLIDDVYNPIGDSKKGFEVQDGGGHTNGIYACLENWSLLGKSISGSKKFIGFIQSHSHLTQVKYADYEINCEKLRKRIDGQCDLLKVFEKMNRVCTFPLDLAYKALQNLVEGSNLYIKENGQLYKFKQVNFDNNSLQLIYTNADGQSIIKTVYDNNMYALWEAFGGEWCYSETEDGIIESNASMELCAYTLCLMSKNSKVDYRENVISKILPSTVVKEGIKNLNSADLWNDDNDFIYFQASANAFGLQNDSTHLADDSLMADPTQVMTALAFNGKERWLAREVHILMGQLIDQGFKSLSKELGLNDSDEKFYQKILKLAYQDLLTSKDVSNATNILKHIAEDYSKRGISIPISSSDIFHKIASMFYAKLNSTTLKRKTTGIAAVFNPSHHMVGVYEDQEGNVYTRTDILRMAEKSDKYKGTPQEIINAFLQTSDKFANKPITNIGQLTLGDTVSIKGEIKIIKSPKDLLNVESKLGSEPVELVLNKGRNLRPSTITWEEYNTTTQQYEVKNIWTSKQTQKCFATKDNPEAYKQAMLEFRQLQQDLYRAQKYPESSTKYINVKTTAGEQIIPKIHRTAHKLGRKTLAEVLNTEKGEHWLTLAKSLLVPPTGIKAYMKNPVEGQIIPTVYYRFNSDIGVVISGEQKVGSQSKLEFIDNEWWIVYNDTKISKVPEGTTYDVVEDTIIIYTPNNITFNDFVQSNFIKNIKQSDILYYANVDRTIQEQLNACHSIIKKDARDLVKEREMEEVASLARSLASSFIITNDSISLRIPSQSYQSFMAMKTVAYMEEDTNDCYCNIYESWFQGSDFDIDKNYTMLYGLDSLGRVAGHHIFHTTINARACYLSLDMPIVNNEEQEKYHTISNPAQQIPNLFNKVNNSKLSEDKLLSELIFEIRTTDRAVELLEEIKFLLLSKNPPAEYQFIINAYNNFEPTKVGMQNKILRNTYLCATSLLNLEHSVQPMSADYVKNLKNEVLQEQGRGVSKIKRHYLNPHSRFLMQELNAIGKIQVGIYANGIKVNGTLQEYFNDYYYKKDQAIQNGEIYIDKYKEFEPINLVFDYPYNEDGQITIGPIRHLANTVISKEVFDSLYGDSISQEQKDELYSQLKHADNVADLLSIMISLATDNAKELVLGEINSTPELANMFVAMISLGVSMKDILRISTTIFEPIVSALKRNRLAEGVAKKVDILKLAKEIFKSDSNNYKSFTVLFNAGQEMTELAKFFKINQGLSARFVEAAQFEEKLNHYWNDLVEKNKLKEAPFNLYLFLNDLEYQKHILDTVNETKTVINIFDVLLHAKHFKSMLSAFDNVNSKLSEKSIKAGFYRWYLDPSKKIKTKQETVGMKSVQKIEVSEDDLTSDDVDNSVSTRQAKISQILNMVDHQAVSEMLKKLPKYTFNVSMLKSFVSKLGGVTKIDTLRGELDLTTPLGIATFVDLMNNTIIPYLKSNHNYEDNIFLLHLTRELNYQYDKEMYDLDFSLYDNDTNLDQLLKNDITESYQKIIANNIGLQNVAGQQISIGELFYLYNLIVHKNKTGRMTKFVTELLPQHRNLEELYVSTWYNLDRQFAEYAKAKKKQTLNQPITAEENRNILFIEDMFNKLSACLEISNTENKKGKVKYGLEQEKDLDLSNSYVYTISPLKTLKSYYSLEEAKALFKQWNLDSNLQLKC